MKKEQIKLKKWFPGRAHFEFHLAEALIKSKYVELVIFFPIRQNPKTEQIKLKTEQIKLKTEQTKLTKSVWGRAHL